MAELITGIVVVVAILLSAAGFLDVREQRRLDDQAAREGSRQRHPSYVKRIRRPFDWERDR